MLKRTLLWVVASLSTCAFLPAQTNVLLQEDFEGGSFPPSGWVLTTSVPTAWDLLDPGECGATSRMPSFGRAVSCNYWTPWASSGMWTTPLFQPTTAPVVLEFDYALELDPSGDTVAVRVEERDNPGVLVDVLQLSDFIGDGSMHHITVVLPVAPPSPWKLHFEALGDGVGDQGRGWRFDNVLVREGAAVTPICPGDGSGAACPCGNVGGANEGCANSLGIGARLSFTGSSSAAADDLVLHVDQVAPFRSVVLFSASGALAGGGVPFHSGLLCGAPPLRRMRLGATDANGRVDFGPGLAAQGGWSAGSSAVLQAWYRDPGGPCGSTSNLTLALAVYWDA